MSGNDDVLAVEDTDMRSPMRQKKKKQFFNAALLYKTQGTNPYLLPKSGEHHKTLVMNARIIS